MAKTIKKESVIWENRFSLDIKKKLNKETDFQLNKNRVKVIYK